MGFALNFLKIFGVMSIMASADAQNCLLVAKSRTAAEDSIRKIDSANAWFAERREGLNLLGSARGVLARLEDKRILQPHPNVVAGWFADFFRAALEKRL